VRQIITAESVSFGRLVILILKALPKPP
jgi:hypothetical protein